MLSAGWQAHTLNAPGKFLISAPEYDTPRRARAYLLTDEAVSVTASRYAELRPVLDDVSLHALDDRAEHHWQAARDERGQGPEGGADAAGPEDARAPDALLWAALSLAPTEGISVPDLMAITRMSRPWVYQRLREMANRGQVAQVERGRWRAVTEHPQ